MKNLLILDLPRSLRAHPLYREIEQGSGIPRDVVEVDAGPEELPGPGAQRLQLQPLRARLQREARGTAPLTTRTMRASRPPLSKNCSTA